MPATEDPVKNKTFFDHLEDLRRVALKVLICLFIVLPLSFYLATPAVNFLLKHCCPPGFNLRYFSPMEPLLVQIKIALMLSLFIGLPYIAYQLWSFIVPGLYQHERFWLGRLSIISWILFVTGIGFCYLFVLPAMMKFSLSMETTYLQASIGIDNFIMLTGLMLLGFGIMFQFPLVIFMLAKTGLVNLTTLKKQRPVILVIILILSAILTPPDVFSQLIMAIPTYLLFEISLLLASISIKSKPAEIINSHDAESDAIPQPPDGTDSTVVNENQEADFTPDQSLEMYDRHYRRKNRKIRSAKGHRTSRK
ncbi:MAG: twin-arginine translocase subunit TatC [Victivallaceae bacterium]